MTGWRLGVAIGPINVIEKMGLVVIRDLFGGVVYSEIKTTESISIKTGFLSQGIYIIQLGDIASKLIVE